MERKRYSFLFLCLVALALMISACAQATSTGTNNNTSSNLTPLQVLQKSADAMKQLKSSHIDLKTTTNTQVVGATTSQTNGTTSGSTHPTASNNSVAMTGTGDQTSTGQSQFNLTVNTIQQPIKIAEVTQGNNFYIQNPQGKWYVLNKSSLDNIGANAFSVSTIDQSSLIAAIQDVKIVDHGKETLNGQSVRHLTASLDKQALKQLLIANPQLKSQLGQQNIDTFLNNAKNIMAVADLWIDESQFYVHRTQLKLDLAEATKSLGQNAPSAVNFNINMTIDLSKFNAPVKINAPTNATATSNPAAVFGLSALPQK